MEGLDLKTIMNLNEGKVFKVNDFQWEDVSGCKMAKPVSPELGSKNITGMIVDIPAGGIGLAVKLELIMK